MQAIRNEQDHFKPFSITIYVDNEKEAKALSTLFGLHHSVPDVVKENSNISDDQRLMLSKLFNEVYQLI